MIITLLILTVFILLYEVWVKTFRLAESKAENEKTYADIFVLLDCMEFARKELEGSRTTPQSEVISRAHEYITAGIKEVKG